MAAAHPAGSFPVMPPPPQCGDQELLPDSERTFRFPDLKQRGWDKVFAFADGAKSYSGAIVDLAIAVESGGLGEALAAEIGLDAADFDAFAASAPPCLAELVLAPSGWEKLRRGRAKAAGGQLEPVLDYAMMRGDVEMLREILRLEPGDFAEDDGDAAAEASLGCPGATDSDDDHHRDQDGASEVSSPTNTRTASTKMAHQDDQHGRRRRRAPGVPSSATAATEGAKPQKAEVLDWLLRRPEVTRGLEYARSGRPAEAGSALLLATADMLKEMQEQHLSAMAPGARRMSGDEPDRKRRRKAGAGVDADGDALAAAARALEMAAEHARGAAAAVLPPDWRQADDNDGEDEAAHQEFMRRFNQPWPEECADASYWDFGLPEARGRRRAIRASKPVYEVVRGIPTKIALTDFGSQLGVVVTQSSRISAVIEASCRSTDHRGEGERACSYRVRAVFGGDRLEDYGPYARAFAKAAARAKVSKPLLVLMALKDHSKKTFRHIVATVKDRICEE